MTKKLASFDFQWQAEAVGLELEKEMIRYEIYPVAREYKNILLGGGDSSAEIWVQERHYEKATEVMNEFLAAAKPSDQEEDGEKNYLKRVVVFSVLGMIMAPVVFNWVATVNYQKMRQQQNTSSRRMLALFFLIAGWGVALVWISHFISAVFK